MRFFSDLGAQRRHQRQVLAPLDRHCRSLLPHDDGDYCSAISGSRTALLSLVVDDSATEQTLVSAEPSTCYYTFELTASSVSLVIPPTPAPTPAPTPVPTPAPVAAGSIDSYGGAVAYASDGTYCYKVVIGDGVALLARMLRRSSPDVQLIIRHPGLWERWLVKLEVKGFFDGADEGTPEFDARMHAALRKFARSPAVLAFGRSEASATFSPQLTTL